MFLAGGSSPEGLHSPAKGFFPDLEGSGQDETASIHLVYSPAASVVGFPPASWPSSILLPQQFDTHTLAALSAISLPPPPPARPASGRRSPLAAAGDSAASAPAPLRSIDFFHPFRLEFPVSLGVGRHIASEPLLLLRLIQPGMAPRLGQPLPLMWQLVRGGSRDDGGDEGEEDEVVRYEMRQSTSREACGSSSGWPAGHARAPGSAWDLRLSSGEAEAVCWQIGGSGHGMVRETYAH